MDNLNTQKLSEDTPSNEGVVDLAWLMAYTDENEADYSDGCGSGCS